MTPREIHDLLSDYYDREMNNVFCYSANYLMNTPKRGYETEWNRATRNAEILEYLLRQYPDPEA